jgi:hypothetical protein
MSDREAAMLPLLILIVIITNSKISKSLMRGNVKGCYTERGEKNEQKK